ncbi:hypothetical protein RYX56_01610 [Alkalihalophilus lindianensis]|uniref:DUF3679 domain-containing protein n=1 Tax=Alkalihalophilus lindianensis TaxID=1630542 RepID=A0ABU3X597_9BACI|nr:hypothetical protein [Alkalihalophilus lindianensis]MDV2683065.1 hypothetical protein [Alkalihalophilus lindianensis]
MMIKKLALVMTLIVGTLLLGSLFGVQHMNEELGITKPVPLEIKTDQSDDSVKPVVQSGATKTQVDAKSELIDKRQKAEDVGRFNFFSELGSNMAEGANRLSRLALSQVMAFVHEVLNGESRSE